MMVEMESKSSAKWRDIEDNMEPCVLRRKHAFLLLCAKLLKDLNYRISCRLPLVAGCQTILSATLKPVCVDISCSVLIAMVPVVSYYF